MRKTLLDDGFHAYLTNGVTFEGAPGIPRLLDLKNTQVPKSIIPFEKARNPKCKYAKNKRQYVHFYMHDRYFHDVLVATSKYLSLFQEFDGVITPDCTMLIGQSACLQQTNTYFNRAVGCYLQRRGIPVIANVRWSDASSFEYCFLGVPKNSIVSISTHGCIRTEREKDLFRQGLKEMINRLNPTDVIVHGAKPPSVFGEFEESTRFHHFPSLIETVHRKGGD